ncbi:MAG: hypothetical protein OEV06_11555 [Anaerolineae bacterium]|nr:hypothetical protein [Anaerolineae bacterium]
MIDKKYTPYVRRLLLITVISTLVIGLINEAVFITLNEEWDRDSQIVELVIPAGTAEKVARGEEQPSIPNELSFILGDELVVINEDEVAHELGPVLVLPGGRGSLVLDDSDEFTYSCSFRPNNYLGISVRPPTNFLTRLEGVFFAVPATVAVAFLYSLLLRPIKPFDPSEMAS